MKNKLTLLIALSIIIIIAFTGSYIDAISETSTTTQQETITTTLPTTTTTIITTTTTTTTTTAATTTTTTTTRPIGEYPVAERVWTALRSQGWSNMVCAGIMGNMMRECGGDTFYLQWDIIGSGSHYGLCQWSKAYHPNAWYLSIEEQVEYLADTLDIGIFDLCETPEEVAYVFCEVYERPGRIDPYGKRRANARKAWEYFVR